MSAAMTPAAISSRLRKVAELADLSPHRRLDAKIDYSPAAITRRLTTVAHLHGICSTLARRTAAVQK